ncbi:unnamed protein product [Gongylonema pulchrum]|uniref:Cullin domain-containing protein n=1 Tax=Gongylonema pulchrum TaxID=637853 RepID=A0A183E5Z3_9BILA|nr:unnamed protein product [Gongylonema pulchrum]
MGRDLEKGDAHLKLFFSTTSKQSSVLATVHPCTFFHPQLLDMLLHLCPPMDVYDYYTSRLSIACNEILSRIRDHSYGLDAYFLESVIDRIFNDPQIDLLSVLPRPVSDVGVEYDQLASVALELQVIRAVVQQKWSTTSITIFSHAADILTCTFILSTCLR